MKKHCPARKAAALLLAAFVTAGALPSAGAADTERKYQEKEITAYLYEAEKTVPLNCLFYEDIPFEPYINAGDFFARLFEADFTVRDDGNGVFTVTAPNGMTMVTNTETDTVHFDFYEKFMTADPADADGVRRQRHAVRVHCADRGRGNGDHCCCDHYFDKNAEESEGLTACRPVDCF